MKSVVERKPEGFALDCFDPEPKAESAVGNPDTDDQREDREFDLVVMGKLMPADANEGDRLAHRHALRRLPAWRCRLFALSDRFGGADRGAVDPRCARKIGVQEVAAGQAGTSKIGLPKNGIEEPGATKVCVAKGSSRKIGFGEIGADCTGAAEVGPVQVRRDKFGSADIRVDESSAAQIGADKSGATKVTATDVDSA